MRSAMVATAMVLAVASTASAEEPALAPSGFEAVDTHGPIYVAPDGAMVKRIPEAPAAPGRPRVMTPGGAPPIPARFTALEVSTDPPLTLWVETVDLSRVVVAETWLAPTPKATAPAAGAPGVWLRPGAFVAVLRQVDDLVEVDYGDAALSLTGWIPAAALGKTYRPAVAAAPQRSASVRLPERAELLDGPDGQPVATVRRELPAVPVAALGPKQAGHVLVERVDRYARIVGWIAERRLRRPGPVIPERSASMLYGNVVGEVSAWVTVDVAAGTAIYDVPGGHVLGRYATPHRLYSIEQRDGHAMVQVQTSIGLIAGWVPWSPPTPR